MTTFPQPTTRPLILAVGFHRLQHLLYELAPEYRDHVDVEILTSRFEQAMLDIQARHRQRPVAAVVSAGANGNYLRAQLSLPVILVRVDGHDILRALTTARATPGRIALLLHDDIPAHVTDFIRAFQLDVEVRSYRSAEEAQACVRQLGQDAVRTVVAPGLITDLAEHAGLTGVFLYSRESVRRALDDALTLVRAERGDPPGNRDAGPHVTRQRQRRTTARHTTRYRLDDLFGEAPALSRARQLARQFAASDATVLISGESGTGKEILAQGIHTASTRATGPFVALNCGAIPESLLESELFGHEDGAFTGARRGGRAGLIESAHTGTLFLDEIAELPANLQVHLLRVLQERQVLRLGATDATGVNVRVIAASHHDLAQRVQARQFRLDLYYRLNILHVALPPLRQRPEDLAALALHRLHAIAKRLKVDPAPALPWLAPLVQAGRHHTWPGNVRELENYLERLLVTTPHLSMPATASALQHILPELYLDAKSNDSALEPVAPHLAPRKGRRARADLTPALVAQVLAETHGHRDLASQRLGISRTTLWRYLNQ